MRFYTFEKLNSKLYWMRGLNGYYNYTKALTRAAPAQNRSFLHVEWITVHHGPFNMNWILNVCMHASQVAGETDISNTIRCNKRSAFMCKPPYITSTCFVSIAHWCGYDLVWRCTFCLDTVAATQPYQNDIQNEQDVPAISVYFKRPVACWVHLQVTR